ncbi:MAG: sugar transporter permease [Naasia sp.]|nr:sugar transporter permease [Naasia sp.]
MSEGALVTEANRVELTRASSTLDEPKGGHGRGRKWRGLLWALPALVLLCLFVYWPLLLNFRYSVEQSNIFTGEQTFVGADNYVKMAGDPIFWRALGNNVLYSVVSVAFQVFGALILAAIIEGLRRERLRSWLRAIYFVPSAMSLTVTGLLFAFIYQPKGGLLNGLLESLGLGGLAQAWLGNPDTAMGAIIAMSQWQGFGYSTLLFAVAIQRIPSELYEAAAIDGIGPIRRVFSITIPLVREMTTLMIIVTLSGAFQVFNEVMVTTSGGPDNSTQVLGTWLYRSGFVKNDFGYAAAIAVVMFVITLTLAIVQVTIANRKRL